MTTTTTTTATESKVVEGLTSVYKLPESSAGGTTHLLPFEAASQQTPLGFGREVT